MASSVFVTTTTSGRTIAYSIDICMLDPASIINLSKCDYFQALCKNGCPNYAQKWSCPPFAPSYEKYIAGWNYLAAFFFQADMSQFSYIKNNYLKIKAANSILKSRADRYLRHMAAQYGTYISTGSCRLCKPCKCKLQLPCAHPQKMSFSFEALGIDVGTFVESYFNSELLWYKHGHLPKYTSVVCGLLTNNDICIDYLVTEYKNLIHDSFY